MARKLTPQDQGGLIIPVTKQGCRGIVCIQLQAVPMTLHANFISRVLWSARQTIAALLFSTIVAVAQELPIIVQEQPTNGAVNVALNAPVIFTFSTPMNPTLTRSQFVDILSFPPALVAMDTSWNADHTQLTHQPISPYRPNTQITWQISGQDSQGRVLGGRTAGAFFTGTTVTRPAQLESVLPPNQATDVPVTSSIVFTFDAVMKKTATTARFYEMAAPTNEFPVSSSWDTDGKVLTCSPITSFPRGTTILWRVEGLDGQGNIFPGAGGGFTTAGTVIIEPTIAVISRGEIATQVATDLLEPKGPEFLAIAGAAQDSQAEIITPTQSTVLLALARGSHQSQLARSGSSYGTNYDAGDYELVLSQGTNRITVRAPLGDTALPGAPRISGWRNPPSAMAGEPLLISWTCEPGGAPAQYLRLRISRGGHVFYETPLPGEPGALTGNANSVVIPPNVLTNEGTAEVRLTAFTFTQEDASTPGALVYAARHRTTRYSLRVVDATHPPPILATTNLTALPLHEPILIQLLAHSEVRPIRYRLVSGGLPPGVTLESSGILTGTATAEGVFESMLELTDLLGRSVTQAVRVGAVALPGGTLPPRLERPAVTSEALLVDLVDPTPLETVLERSSNLSEWHPYYTNATAETRTTIQVPLSEGPVFLRARAKSIYPPAPAVNPLTVYPMVSANPGVSATLDEWGGSLSLTNAGGFVFTLTLQPGALGRTETITMREITQVAGLPLSGGLIAAVDLQPEGLTFDKLARLDITPPTAVNLRTLVGFNAENDGARFGLQPSFLTNNTISLHLRHFSMAGAGSGTAGDTGDQTQQHPPGEGSKRSDQEAADELARCRMDPNCDVNSEEEKARLRDVFVRQADQNVIPRLKAAIGQDSAVEDAILGWLSWMRQVALTAYDGDTFNAQGSGALENRLRLAQSLAGQVLTEAIRFNCRLCTRSDFRRIARVITFSRWANLLGFDAGGEPFQCMEQCLKFKFVVAAVVDSLQGDRKIRTTAGAEFDLEPLNLDGSSDQLTLKGEGEWSIDKMDFPNLPKGCSSPTSATSGTAEVVMLRLSLYVKKTTTTDEGELVTYEMAPQVRLSLRADLEKMPTEGRKIKCGDLVNQEVEDMFGPTFLALHNDEVQIPTAGSLASEILGGPVINVTDFSDPGSGETLGYKLYIRTQPIKDGDIGERTTFEVLHQQ